MYAIVDIETTGGYAENHRITEIAIYHHNGIEVTDHFHALINPGRNIPFYITGLTDGPRSRASWRNAFLKRLAPRVRRLCFRPSSRGSVWSLKSSSSVTIALTSLSRCTTTLSQNAPHRGYVALGGALGVWRRAFSTGLVVQAAGAAGVSAAGFWALGSQSVLGDAVRELVCTSLGRRRIERALSRRPRLDRRAGALVLARYLRPTRAGAPSAR